MPHWNFELSDIYEIKERYYLICCVPRIILLSSVLPQIFVCLFIYLEGIEIEWVSLREGEICQFATSFTKFLVVYNGSGSMPLLI